MADGIITDVIDVERTQKQIDQTIAGLSKIAELIAQQGGVVKFSKGIIEQKTAQEGLNKANDEAAKQLKELQQAEAALAKAQSDHARQIADIKEKTRIQNDLNKDAVRMQGLAKDSIKALEIEVKKLTQAYNQLSAAERSSAKGTALSEKIKGTNDSLRGLKTSMGDWKANVGNYTSGTAGLEKMFGKLSGSAEGVQQSVGKMEKVFSMLPAPIMEAKNGIQGFAQLMLGGAIGIGVAALSAVIWGITKAISMWTSRNDEAIQSNIDLIRSLAATRNSMKEHMDALKEMADSRSQSEKDFSTTFFNEARAREDAAAEYAKSMEQLEKQKYFKVGEYEQKKQAIIDRFAQRQVEIEKNKNAAITNVTNKAMEVKDKNIGKIDDEKKSLQELQEAYERFADQVDAVMARMGLADPEGKNAPITRLTPKKATSINTGAKLEMQSNKPMLDYLAYMQDEAQKGKEETPEEKTKREAQEWNKRFQIASETISKIDNIVNMSYQSRYAAIDEEMRKDQEAKDRELKNAGNNGTKIREINDRYDQKEKEREKEKRRVQKEQAKYQQKSAGIQAFINGLLGFTAGAATLDWVGAALALAAGIAESAMIFAQPLPSYRKGRKGGSAELANVGEAGRELIVTKDGQMMLTPSTTTRTFLPEGSSVIPHDQLIDMAGRATTFMPSYNTQSYAMAELAARIDSLHGGFEMLGEIVKNKTEHTWVVSGGELHHLTKRGNTHEEWINERVRH